MSKIGAYNLQLQEQANELGFETVQEALDAGYVICEMQMRCVPAACKPTLVKSAELEEQAHNDWLAERDQVIEELTEVGAFLTAHNEKPERVDHAIEFIKRGEV